MKDAHSIVLIFFDLWTSPNAHKILGAVAYFINKAGQYHYVVLGLCEVIGEYNNKNMASVFFDIFKDYRIYNNIGYFIADNVELNDICIDIIFQAFYLGILVKKQKVY